MTYKIEQNANGNFVVKQEKEMPIDRPWWKFWGPTSANTWVVALKKDGSVAVYEQYHHAKAFVQFKGGKLVK